MVHHISICQRRGRQEGHKFKTSLSSIFNASRNCDSKQATQSAHLHITMSPPQPKFKLITYIKLPENDRPNPIRKPIQQNFQDEITSDLYVCKRDFWKPTRNICCNVGLTQDNTEHCIHRDWGRALKLVTEFSVNMFAFLGQRVESFYGLKNSMTLYSKDSVNKMYFPRHFFIFLDSSCMLSWILTLPVSTSMSLGNLSDFQNRDRYIFSLQSSLTMCLLLILLVACFFLPIPTCWLSPSLSFMKSLGDTPDPWHWVICFFSVFPEYPGWNPCDSDYDALLALRGIALCHWGSFSLIFPSLMPIPVLDTEKQPTEWMIKDKVLFSQLQERKTV